MCTIIAHRRISSPENATHMATTLNPRRVARKALKWEKRGVSLWSIVNTLSEAVFQGLKGTHPSHLNVLKVVIILHNTRTPNTLSHAPHPLRRVGGELCFQVVMQHFVVFPAAGNGALWCSADAKLALFNMVSLPEVSSHCLSAGCLSDLTSRWCLKGWEGLREDGLKPLGVACTCCILLHDTSKLL